MNNLYGSFLKALYTMFEARNSRLDVFFLCFSPAQDFGRSATRWSMYLCMSVLFSV